MIVSEVMIFKTSRFLGQSVLNNSDKTRIMQEEIHYNKGFHVISHPN